MTNTTTSDQPSNQATKNQATPLRGWVNTFYRHYKGKKLGPYYVRRWRVGRRLHKEYIKPQDVEKVKAECQAYKERKKRQRATSERLNNMIGNLDYIVKMVKWQDQGKLRPQDHAFMRRLNDEGWEISGRPSTRRRVTRHLATIDGKKMIVKTVFELDGTTRVFMVPIFTNRMMQCLLNPIEWLGKLMDDVWEEVHGHQAMAGQPHSNHLPFTTYHLPINLHP